jgi:hypothetical protein
MDTPCHDEKSGHDDNKADVLMQRLEQAPASSKNQQVIKNCASTEDHRNLWVMTLPPVMS